MPSPGSLSLQFADGVYLVLLMGLLEGYFVSLHSFFLTPDSFEQKVRGRPQPICLTHLPIPVLMVPHLGKGGGFLSPRVFSVWMRWGRVVTHSRVLGNSDLQAPEHPPCTPWPYPARGHSPASFLPRGDREGSCKVVSPSQLSSDALSWAATTHLLDNRHLVPSRNLSLRLECLFFLNF